MLEQPSIILTLRKIYQVAWLPHLLLGLLKALGDKVDLLEGGDQALLVAGGPRVKHLHTGLVRQSMLPATRWTSTQC